MSWGIESVLEQANLEKTLDKKTYRKRLLAAQLRLRELARRLYQEKRSMVIAYEGWDAGGKGGNIRRVVEKLDPRGYHVYTIAAPSGEDRTHHYLWRFWRRLIPADEKQIVVFDRTWYGRVLVERVEGFATRAEWERAYDEINDFERQLTDHGIFLCKFWLHISRDEQLRRFNARRDTPHKQWKLTDEDWRNREKWGTYRSAVEDMIARTHTDNAPWTIVEGEDKLWARVRTIEAVVDRLERGLDPTE